MQNAEYTLLCLIYQNFIIFIYISQSNVTTYTLAVVADMTSFIENLLLNSLVKLFWKLANSCQVMNK